MDRGNCVRFDRIAQPGEVSLLLGVFRSNGETASASST